MGRNKRFGDSDGTASRAAQAAFAKLCEIQTEEGISATAWKDATGLPPRTFFRAKNSLRETSRIRSRRDGRQVRYWPRDSKSKEMSV